MATENNRVIVSPQPRAWKNIHASVMLFLAIAVVGCEQTAPTDGLPYVNHIVIKGILVAGQPLDSISVSHTLPLSATYDPYSAAIPTARVTISVDGRTIPLTYTGYGYFGDPAKDTVWSGKIYHISVDWNGLHAEASTLVPSAPIVDSLGLSDFHSDTSIYQYGQYGDTSIDFGAWLEAAIQPRAGEAYEIASDSVGAIGDSNYYSYHTNYYAYYSYSSNRLRRINDASSDGRLRIRDFFELNPPDTLFRIAATLTSFDGAYYDFIQSYGSYSNGDLFGTTGTNPKWNVTGDGIGLFIGTASTRIDRTVHR